MTEDNLTSTMERLRKLMSNSHATAVEVYEALLRLARSIDKLLSAKQRPLNCQELYSLIRQTWGYKQSQELRPALIMVLESGKGGCIAGWFSALEAEELVSTLNQLLSQYKDPTLPGMLAVGTHSDPNAMSTFGSSYSTAEKLLSVVLGRFCPRLAPTAILLVVNIKPGYQMLVSDFHVTQALNLRAGERLVVRRRDPKTFVDLCDHSFGQQPKRSLLATKTRAKLWAQRLFLACNTRLSTSECLVTPPHANFLINGRGVLKRTLLTAEKGPVMPSDITMMARQGANFLQVIGEISGEAAVAQVARADGRTAESVPSVLGMGAEATTCFKEREEEDDLQEGPTRTLLSCPIRVARQGEQPRTNEDSSERGVVQTPPGDWLVDYFSSSVCFDYDNYLSINERRPAWRCPCCNAPASCVELRLDATTAKILEEVRDEPDVVAILKFPDGTWLHTRSEKRRYPDDTHADGSGDDVKRTRLELPEPSGASLAERHASSVPASEHGSLAVPHSDAGRHTKAVEHDVIDLTNVESDEEEGQVAVDVKPSQAALAEALAGAPPPSNLASGAGGAPHGAVASSRAGVPEGPVAPLPYPAAGEGAQHERPPAMRHSSVAGTLNSGSVMMPAHASASIRSGSVSGRPNMQPQQQELGQAAPQSGAGVQWVRLLQQGAVQPGAGSQGPPTIVAMQPGLLQGQGTAVQFLAPQQTQQHLPQHQHQQQQLRLQLQQQQQQMLRASAAQQQQARAHPTQVWAQQVHQNQVHAQSQPHLLAQHRQQVSSLQQQYPPPPGAQHHHTSAATRQLLQPQGTVQQVTLVREAPHTSPAVRHRGHASLPYPSSQQHQPLQPMHAAGEGQPHSLVAGLQQQQPPLASVAGLTAYPRPAGRGNDSRQASHLLGSPQASGQRAPVRAPIHPPPPLHQSLMGSPSQLHPNAGTNHAAGLHGRPATGVAQRGNPSWAEHIQTYALPLQLAPLGSGLYTASVLPAQGQLVSGVSLSTAGKGLNSSSLPLQTWQAERLPGEARGQPAGRKGGSTALPGTAGMQPPIQGLAAAGTRPRQASVIDGWPFELREGQVVTITPSLQRSPSEAGGQVTEDVGSGAGADTGSHGDQHLEGNSTANLMEEMLESQDGLVDLGSHPEADASFFPDSFLEEL